MEFAVLISIPFILAAIFALPVFDSPSLKDGRTWLATGAMALLCAAIVGYFPYIQAAAETHTAVTGSITWLPELGLTLSFYLDGLSLLFALVITGIGAGIFLYAGYYFDDADEQRRFFMWLAAFAGAMLGIVLSGNLITLFIFWELTSITSYMLIGFNGAQSEEARYGARQAFLITGGGGLALLAGLLLLAAAAGQAAGSSTPIYELAQIVKLDLSQHPYYSFIALFVLIGAFTKSAQFPFHFWLPGAMSAPTPASAYLHSATMVKAGIYLLARLYPTLHANPLWLQALTGLGLITLLIGAFFAISQRDLKALLAYSTVSILGMVVALLGLPDYAGVQAAYVLIMAHALYKAALFLAVGTVDHNTGTRLLDHLGGLRQYMPVMAVIVVVSALSMAGVPVFFGFVAKEALLDAFLHEQFAGQAIALIVIAVSAALTIVAAGIVAWDVFFKAPTHEIHFHAGSRALNITPGLLAVGSAFMGFLLAPLINPLLETATHDPAHLHLVPESLSNPAFLTSMGILLAGSVLFYTRTKWLNFTTLPLPKGTDIYRMIFSGIDRAGTFVLKAQIGQVRYYLIVILGVVAYVLLSSGLVNDLLNGQTFSLTLTDITGETVLRAILLAMSVVAALATVLARVHIVAALALGVVGYAVGGIFLLEHAPDVSLVQFIVETLTTILLILMLGRISQKMRREATTKLWQGRSYFDDINLGIVRDIVIASAVGLAVFVFTLTALVNRPDSQTMDAPAFCDFAPAEVDNLPDTARQSIVRYHLCHTYQDLNSTDVVGAIVDDYRGMDTYIEITVFSVAALGVLTLLSRGLPNTTSPFVPQPNIAATQGEYDPDALEDVKDATSLNTPFTRWVARIVLPLTFLVALSQLLYGGDAPGDGFTAGALLGLVTALWYVIFGHAETRERLPMLKPYHLLRAGLGLEMFNALLALVVKGHFMAYVDYGELLHLNGILHEFSLHLSSTLIYEMGVCLTVFGVITTIMETIAHPTPSADEGGD